MKLMKSASSFVLSEKQSSMYPGGYISGDFPPAAWVETLLISLYRYRVIRKTDAKRSHYSVTDNP